MLVFTLALSLVAAGIPAAYAHHRPNHPGGGGGGDDGGGGGGGGGDDPSAIGGFEIDGNLAQDNPPDDDWETVNETVFPDTVGQGDDIFRQGSKNLDPGGWTCGEGKAPGKNDLVEGGVFFREVDGEQFLYVRYERAAVNGDANVDFEFNQSTLPNPACPELPLRTDDDLLVTYDTENGGATIIVRLWRWQFTGDGVGEFIEISDGANFVRGEHWDGAVNIPNTIPGLKAGAFGEAGINVSQSPIGDIGCGEFGAVHLKTRASTSINADLKDRTVALRFRGPCPDSELHKDVRNVSDDGSFGPTATAAPGNTLEYRLTYHNDGPIPATNVVVSDKVPDRSTLVSCSPSCGAATGSGPGTPLTWSLGTVEADGSRTVTFRVQLDSVFPVGSTEIKNIATVTTAEEGDTFSNEAVVTVTAAPAFQVAKSSEKNTVEIGETITYSVNVRNVGNAAGSTTVIDDYDEDHVVVSNISHGGTEVNGTIVWNSGTLQPQGSVTFTYSATFGGTFENGAGTQGCPPGRFPVVNSVTVTGHEDSHVVCVASAADLSVTKTASDTTADIGDEITYTIAITNSGGSPGTTTVVDDYDEDHLDIGTISDDGVDNGDTITWTDVTVGANQTVQLSYTATIKGPFTDGANTGGCENGRFPVVNQVQIDGDSDSATVCVRAEPAFTVSKSANPSSVTVGENATYTITVTNLGEGPGTQTVVDDYDQAHVAVSNISHNGSDDGDNITWTVTLGPGDSVNLTYTASFHGPFTGTPGGEPCPPTQFRVFNTVTVEDDEATHIQCVTAPGALTVAKTADSTVAQAGDLITYTLSFENDGDGTATAVTLQDEHGSEVEFVSCTDGCTEVSSTQVRWDLGDLAPGDTGSVTVTFRVLDNVGCVVCNVATISGGNSPSASDQLCIEGVPSPDPDGANANGSAYGLSAKVVTLLGLVTVNTGKLVPSASSQSGVGTSSHSNQLASVNIPGVVTAGVIPTQTMSSVEAEPARATQTSVAQVADLNILGGLVTADLVRAVASTEATGEHAAFSSVGTTFTNLTVAGVPYADVAPNTQIDLNPTLFGAGSYVALREEVGTITRPEPGQLEGGTYAADLEVNMIRVHITRMLPLGEKIDIVVASATAHSDFPQTTRCELTSQRSVSANATVLRLRTNPALANTRVGFSSIPPSGGWHQQQLAGVQLLEGALATADAVRAHSRGTTANDEAWALGEAETTALCVLEGADGCVIGADLIFTQVLAVATAAGQGTVADTQLVGLTVFGTPIELDPEPNTTVLDLGALGFLIVNEQFCDFGASLANGCDDGEGHAGRTVRALRLVLLDPAPGGLLGAQLVVGESHAGATYRLH